MVNRFPPPNGIFQNNGFQVAFSHLKLELLVLQFDQGGI
jgi:hypothetical protein